MIGQRLFAKKQLGQGRYPASFNIKWLICYNCRELRECKLPSINEFPFLWSPNNAERSNKCNPDSRIQLNTNCRYKPLKKAISLDTNNVVSNPAKPKLTKSFEPTENINRTCTYPVRATCLTPMEEALKCSEYSLDNHISHETSKIHDLHCENRGGKMKKRLVRNIKNVPVLYFSKPHKLRVSKYKNTKKLTGSKELVLGRIADNLLVEWPALFESKASADFSYLSNSIFFDNTVLGIKTRGLKWYKLQLHLFKWATKLVWSESSLEILQITKNPEDNTIKVRWLTNGKPRLLYPMILLGKTPALRYMDFFSIVKVGENETIEAHRLTKLVPRQSTQRRNPIISLLTLFGLTGRNVPEFQEKPVLPSSSESS